MEFCQNLQEQILFLSYQQFLIVFFFAIDFIILIMYSISTHNPVRERDADSKTSQHQIRFFHETFQGADMNSVKLIFLALVLCQSTVSTASTPDVSEVALTKAEVLLMTGSKLTIKDTSRGGTRYYIQTKPNGHTSVWDDSSAVYGGYLKDDVPGVSQDNTCVEYAIRTNGFMCFRLIKKDDGQIYVKRFNVDRFNGQVSKQREDPLYN